MPSVINGIGTWYYGKGNLTHRQGTCKHCRKTATLRSYDTTMYFCVVFVPIIPLGKRRILDECSSCRRHTYVKLSVWQQQKIESLARSREAYLRDPTNPERAAEVVGAIFAFQDYAEFRELAPTILSRLGKNPDTLRMVGNGYVTLGELEKAAELYRASLNIEDRPETREPYAVVLIRLGRPDEAERSLQHIMESGQANKASYLFFLVKGYQSTGEHGKAIYVLDKLAAILPEIQQNKEFKKIRKKSEKNLRTGKRFGVETFTTSAPRTGPEHSVTAVVSKWIAPVLFLVVLVAYLGVAYTRGQSRLVHLVNGLSKPYVATVNETRYKLRPMSVMPIRVAEGDVTVSGEGKGFSFPAQTVQIKTNFFSRPFVSPTLVLNPDTVAVFDRQTVYYAVPPKEPPPGKSKLFVGEPFYDFGSLDYVFENPPHTISMPEHSNPVSKESVKLFTGKNLGDMEIVLVLRHDAGEEATIRYLTQRLRIDVEDDFYFGTLQSLMDHEAFLEFLRKGVEARPVRITWHRWYQDTRETEESAGDLTAKYRSLLEADPDNPGLQYLLGRILRDPDEAEALFRKSVSGPHPCAFGYFAWAYSCCARGEFDQAVELMAKARDLEPENSAFVNTHWQYLMRAGRYDEAIKELETLRARAPLDILLNFSIVRACLLKGDQTAAADNNNLWIRGLEHEYGPDGSKVARDHYEMARAYIMGDLDGYMAVLKNDEPASFDFWDAMAKGDLAAACASLEESENMDEDTLLLLYIAKKKSGDDEAAESVLAELTPSFRARSWEVAEMLDSLEGRTPPDVARLLKLPMDPDLKALFLTALGLAYPEHQEAFFDLARKLNFKVDTPYHYLNAVLNPASPGVQTHGVDAPGSKPVSAGLLERPSAKP